jgi:hypothetical protein
MAEDSAPDPKTKETESIIGDLCLAGVVAGTFYAKETHTPILTFRAGKTVFLERETLISV